MDHRTLGVTGEHLYLVGGMGDAQQVTGRTIAISARAVNP